MLTTNPVNLILEDISVSEDDPLFRLHESTVFTYGAPDRFVQITIEAGFETNFASIPQAVRSVITNVNKYDRCYVWHDYLYSKDCKLTHITKANADVMLRKSLQQYGMSDTKAWTIYLAVKLFGSSHFRR